MPLALALAVQAQAVELLEDDQLASISGQDGLTAIFSTANAGVSLASQELTMDSQVLRMSGVSLVGKSNINNVTVGDAPTVFINTLDVGSTNPGNVPALNYHLTLDSAARLRINDMFLGVAGTRSAGTMALEADSAQLQLTNLQGLANATNVGGAYLMGEILSASMYYRQITPTLQNPSLPYHAGTNRYSSSPYLIMDNFDLRWEVPKATLGFTNGGLLMATLDKVASPSTPLADTLLKLQLSYDMKFRNHDGDNSSGGLNFTRNDANAGTLMNFGWIGSVKDARLLWAGGGAWSAGGTWNTPTTPSTTQGLRLASRWNYINNSDAATLGDATQEFRWRFGEAGGKRLSIELSDWKNMPGVDYGHDFPLLAIDLIPAGQGPGGASGTLCWGSADNGGTGACTGGGQAVRLQPGIIRSYLTGATTYDSVGILMRDGNLRAISNKVKLVDDDGIRTTKDWGLIYTLANLDGNIYLYPGGNPGNLDRGLIADIALISQTLDGGVQNDGVWSNNIASSSHINRFYRGSHLMIADTSACSTKVTCGTGETGMGIGLIGSSILIMANDARLWLKPYTGSNNYDGGIDILSPQMRYAVKGTFGGGTLPLGRQIVTGGLIGMNVEGLLNLRLSPSPATDPSHYLGYSMAVRLYNIADNSLYQQDTNVIASGSGSFYAFAEQNRPDKQIVLGGMAGDFAIQNGRVDLKDGTGTDSDGDGYYKLKISNEIHFGTQANDRLLKGTSDGVTNGALLPGGTTARAFAINDVTFGGDKLGSVVIPSGQWNYSLTLRPQCIGNGVCP